MMQCLINSYQVTLKTQVHACWPDGDRWRIKLADTIFYPEGGGQPSDRGCIDDVQIEDVQKSNGEVWHYAKAPLEVGQEVVARIDWARRFDHMQQHTGQHLLTAIILKHFSWKTVGFHISADVATIDLETPHITPKQQAQIEDWVNQEILEHRAIIAQTVSYAEFTQLGVRSRGIPDWVKGPIRVVEIEGLDLNNCGGTHLSNTGELQQFAILRCSKLKKNTRLTFVYGNRVRKHLHHYLDQERALNEIFQQGDHVQIARTWAEQRREWKGQRKAMISELIAHRVSEQIQRGAESIFAHYSDLTLPELLQMRKLLLAQVPQKSIFLMSDDVFVACIHDAENHKSCGMHLRAMGAKGGGKVPLMQGKMTRAVHPHSLGEEIASYLS